MNRPRFCPRLPLLALVLSLFTSSLALAQLPGARSVTVGSDVFIGGNFLELGINSGGSFGTKGGIQPVGFFGTTNRQDIGMSTDLDGFGVGTNESFDYFLPGTPYVAWAAGYKIAGVATSAINSRNSIDQISPVSVVNLSAGTNLTVVTTGVLASRLQIVQRISFGATQKFFKMEIGLTNVGAVPLDSVRYMWDVDPDNTVDINGSYRTINTISNTFAAGDRKAVVQARSTGSATVSDLVLYSVDPRAVAFHGGSLAVTAGTIYNASRWDTPMAKGTTATEDRSIAMTADVGTLAPGRGTTFIFYIGLGADVLTDIAAVVLPPAPVLTPTIIDPPQSFRVLPGTNVTFTVGLSTNTSAPGPFTYQWRRFGFNIPGANSSSLTLTNVQTADDGSYTVRVGNIHGIVTSPPGTLEVLRPPVITLQPLDTNGLAGDSVSFAVEATGSEPLAYQWQLNGTNVNGAVTNALNLDAITVRAGGLYSVIISNLAGVVISSNATLVVHSTPIIITPPESRVANAATPVTFSVFALGDAPFTYQWLLNGTNLAGATGMSLTIGAATPSHEGLYSVVVRNSLGSATSSAARLTVLPLSVVVPWVAASGGGGSDVGNAIAVDAAGNSYVAGYFSGTATFGTNTLVSAGNTDIFITKHNSSGQLLWARRAGGPGYDTAKGIAVDALGNCYVTGAYEGEASFSGGTSLTNTSPTSYADVFLAQYDSAGALGWVRSAGVEFANDEGTAVAVDNAGNVLVTGRSVLDTFAGVPVANPGRIFVAKYTSTGAEVWAHKAGSYSGGILDTGTGIATDNAGNVFVGGVFHSPVATFGIGTFTNYGAADMFIAKFDAAGTLQWARQAGGAGEDTASGVAVAADGSAYLVGAVAGNANFSGTNVTSVAGAASDGFVAKYAGDGRVTWVRQFGGRGLSAARAVAVDAAGTVHVTGYFSGGVTFGTNTLRGISGSYDAFLARMDAGGVFAFAQQAGGADLSGDFGLGVGVDGAGNSVITGYFSGTSNVGGNSLPSRGAEDVLVTRFNQFTGGGVPQVGFQPVAGRLRMRWPLAASSYILQSTTNLLNPVWVDEPNALTLSGSDLETEVPVGNQVRFFRLRKP